MRPARETSRPRRKLAWLALALVLGLLGLYAILRGGRLQGGTGAPSGAEEQRIAARQELSDPLESTGAGVRSPAAPTPVPADGRQATAAPRADELTGRVVDRSGDPVPGAEVALQTGVAREFSVLDLEVSRAAERIAETITDEGGAFRFPLDRGIPVDVLASAAGFLEQVVANRHAGEYVEITLSSGYRVHGRITRERDGAPVEGAVVRVFRLGGPFALQRETVSASDGHYELRFGFPSDAILEVVPLLEQSSDWIRLSLGPDGTVEQDVVLQSGVVVEGRVSDAITGVPIDGAVVGEGWTYSRTATTDAAGEYRMPGFGNPGYGELHARAEGYGEAQRIHLPGAVDGVLRVDFALAPGHAAHGRIVDASGRPIEGAYVAAVASQDGDEGQMTDWVSGTTGPDGHFTLDGLTPHLRHALLAKKHGFATHVFDFPPSETTQTETDLGELALTPPALVAGRVVDGEGEGIAEVSVALNGSNRDRYRLGGEPGDDVAGWYVSRRKERTGPDGSFCFAGVAAGSYKVGARKRGWVEPGLLRVEVEESVDREDLVLRMVGGSSIRGRVVDEQGGPVLGVALAVQLVAPDGSWPTSGSTRGSARTDAEGGFELQGLVAGDYRIDAYPFWVADWDPDAPWLQTTLERVRTGAEVELVLEKGATIGGVLLDAGGKPLFGHEIEPVGGVRTTGALVTTDLEGRFTIAVPHGTVCDLEVHAPSESDLDETLLLTLPEVEAGTTDLVLRLP